MDIQSVYIHQNNFMLARFTKFATPLITLTRPQTWVYTLGAYLIGVTTGWHSFNFSIVLLALFFTLPAGLVTYGPSYLLERNKTGRGEKPCITSRSLIIISSLVTIPCLLYLSFGGFTKAAISFFFYLVFAIYTTAPPLAMSSRPNLASIWSGLRYTSIGLIGFYAAGGQALIWLALLAGFIWVIAIEIIEPLLSPTRAVDAWSWEATQHILIATFLYTVSAIIATDLIGLPALVLGAIYLLTMLKLLLEPRVRSTRRYLPRIHLITLIVVILIFFTRI
jgi:hypothetical protein